jgi:hypothetical protein
MAHIEKLATYREHLLRLLREQEIATLLLSRQQDQLLRALATLNQTIDKAYNTLVDLGNLPKGHILERSRKIISVRHNLLT